MAEGRVVEDGPPAELAGAAGVFAGLRTAWHGGAPPGPEEDA